MLRIPSYIPISLSQNSTSRCRLARVIDRKSIQSELPEPPRNISGFAMFMSLSWLVSNLHHWFGDLKMVFFCIYLLGRQEEKNFPAVMWRTMRHLQVENVNLYEDSKGLWRPHITWFKRGKLERWIEQWNWLFGVHRGWQTTQLCKDYHGPFLRIPLKQPGFNGK